MNQKLIVFTTLASNQTNFFIGVGQALKKAGINVAIISFHEGSDMLLEKSGLRFFNLFSEARNHSVPDAQIEETFLHLIAKLKPVGLEYFFTHETAAFEVRELKTLKRKFIEYSLALETIFSKLGSEGQSDVSVVQELGGFLSLATTMFVARARGLDHFFIEPGFFRGRVMFSKNTYWAPKVREGLNSLISQQVKGYLQDTVTKNQLVIPEKDAWQYKGVFGKILNLRNFKRLGTKLWQKYVLGEREEFSHIRAYVRRHTRMMENRILLNSKYSQIPTEPFIYFPLHVPMDVALTVRSPFFLDQVALLDFLSRSVPFGYKVAFKEHPALVGSVDRSRIKALLHERQNVVMLHPTLNNFEVVRKAAAIVTVNSKSGAESLLLGKGVVVLGDSFYTDSSLVYRPQGWRDVGDSIKAALAHRPDIAKIESFFQAAWDQSYPGEIYSLRENNCEVFADSIIRGIGIKTRDASVQL